MLFDIITIFPKIFDSYLNESIIKRALQKNLIKIKVHNLRNFTKEKNRKVDDRPFGGGPGMVLQAQPIIKALEFSKIKKKNAKTKVILFSVGGKQFNEKITQKLKKNDQLIMVCGRYEGIDERVKKVIKDMNLPVEEISIGPYVLTGGELPALIVLDAVSRKISGVLGKKDSLEERRLGAGVPVYTRPAEFNYKKKKYAIPKVLLSGNHKKIEEWRKKNKK